MGDDIPVVDETDQATESQPTEIKVEPGVSVQIVSLLTRTTNAGIYEVKLGRMASKNRENKKFVEEESLDAMIMKVIEYDVSEKPCLQRG